MYIYIYIHIHQYIILNVVFATPSQLIKTTTRHRLCSAGIDFGVVVVVGRASLLCASVRSQTLCKTVRIGSTEAPRSDRSIWTGTVSSQFWGNSKGRLSQRDSSSHRTRHRECLEVGRGNVTLSCSYRSLCCNWLSQGPRLSVPVCPQFLAIWDLRGTVPRPRNCWNRLGNMTRAVDVICTVNWTVLNLLRVCAQVRGVLIDNMSRSRTLPIYCVR